MKSHLPKKPLLQKEKKVRAARDEESRWLSDGQVDLEVVSIRLEPNAGCLNSTADGYEGKSGRSFVACGGSLY